MAIENRLAGYDGIEQHILAVLCARPKLTFTSLAETVPEYRWDELLRALHRLRERRQVDLWPIQWDYEVMLSNPTVKTSMPCRSI